MLCRYVILFVLTCAALRAEAQTQDSAKPAPDALAGLETRLREHPEIQAYIHRAESAQLQASGELGLPDPTLFIQEQDYPLGRSQSQDAEEKMIGIKQMIPAFGTRTAKSEKNAAAAHKEKLQGAFAFAGMKAKMIQALAQQQRIQEQKKILAAQAELLRTTQRSFKGRIAADAADSSLLAMSRAENADIDVMRADLDAEELESQAMLRNMLGDAPRVALPPLAPRPWDGDPQQTYPLLIAATEIDIAHKEVDMRRAEFYPNLELQGSYGRMRNGDNAGTVMLGMSIPVWAVQSQIPKLSGAKAALHAAEADQDAIRRQMIEKMTLLKAQIAASAAKIEAMNHKTSLLDTAYNAQTREYAAGKSEFAMPIKTRRELLAVRYQLAAEQAKRTALIADFNHYLADGESQ